MNRLGGVETGEGGGGGSTSSATGKLQEKGILPIEKGANISSKGDLFKRRNKNDRKSL